MYESVLIAAPEAPAVSLEQAKRHLNVTHDHDDELIMDYVDAAVNYVDGPTGILNRALITQTWEFKFSGLSNRSVSRRLRLPCAPIQEVLSVTYPSGSDDVVVDDSVYELILDHLSWVDPAYGMRVLEAGATYQLRCGYGDTWVSVPPAIRQAILLTVGTWYLVREDVVIGGSVGSAEIPVGAMRLLKPFMRKGF